MGISLSVKSRIRNAWANWRTIPTFLIFAVLGMGVGILRAPAQQAPLPKAPSTPAAQGGSAHPEEGTAQEKPHTIRTTVELVNVPVTAKNKHGQPVIDLNVPDFRVYEDGVEQKITHFERETNTPIRLGLILDTSNSARRALSYEKEAASEFVYLVLHNGGTKNEVFLQTFDATSSVIQDFTNDPDLLNEKIQDLRSGGGKALNDAIYFACLKKMRYTGPPEDTRRVLVVLSDGLDVESKHTLDQAVSMARMTETMIYTVGTAAYGFTNPGDKMLDDISDETGGYASFPLRESAGVDLETGYLSHGQIGDTSQNKGLGAETGTYSAQRMMHLADALQGIGRDLEEEYTLGYRPIRDALDGTYRSIKVETSRRGVILHWKPGYFATAE